MLEVQRWTADLTERRRPENLVRMSRRDAAAGNRRVGTAADRQNRNIDLRIGQIQRAIHAVRRVQVIGVRGSRADEAVTTAVVVRVVVCGVG